MKAPVRLREAPDASDEMRDLLASARRPHPMSAEQSQRSARRVRAILVAPPVAIALGFWTKAVALAAIASVGAVTAAVTLLPARAPQPTPAASSAQPAPRARGVSGPRGAMEAPNAPSDAPATPAELSPTGAPEVPAPEIPESSAVPAAPAAASSTPATTAKLTGDRHAAPRAAVEATPAISADDLAREAALLESARASVATAPAAALAALNEHARRFPHGQLAAERELLRVDALTRLGQRGDAAARGRELMRRDDGKLYEGRVRTLLDAPDASAPKPSAP